MTARCVCVCQRGLLRTVRIIPTITNDGIRRGVSLLGYFYLHLRAGQAGLPASRALRESLVICSSAAFSMCLVSAFQSGSHSNALCHKDVAAGCMRPAHATNRLEWACFAVASVKIEDAHARRSPPCPGVVSVVGLCDVRLAKVALRHAWCVGCIYMS